MLLPSTCVRNLYLETLAITNWPSVLVITDCSTSCKRIRVSRSTGQAIEILHRTPEPRGSSALKTISVLLNKTAEPVPEMGFALGEITLYLERQHERRLHRAKCCGMGGIVPIDHAIFAQVS